MAIIDNIDRVLNRDSIGLCRKYTNYGVSVENRVMYVVVFKTVTVFKTTSIKTEDTIGTRESVPLILIEVIELQRLYDRFTGRDKCPLNRGVPLKEVSER